MAKQQGKMSKGKNSFTINGEKYDVVKSVKVKTYETITKYGPNKTEYVETEQLQAFQNGERKGTIHTDNGYNYYITKP